MKSAGCAVGSELGRIPTFSSEIVDRKLLNSPPGGETLLSDTNALSALLALPMTRKTCLSVKVGRLKGVRNREGNVVDGTDVTGRVVLRGSLPESGFNPSDRTATSVTVRESDHVDQSRAKNRLDRSFWFDTGALGRETGGGSNRPVSSIYQPIGMICFGVGKIETFSYI